MELLSCGFHKDKDHSLPVLFTDAYQAPTQFTYNKYLLNEQVGFMFPKE